MTVTLYTDGWGGSTWALTLPGMGQQSVLTIDGYVTVSVRHVSRTIHPTSSADEYFQGYDDTYEFSISPSLGFDFDKARFVTVTDYYYHPEGSDRPDTPSESSTSTVDFGQTTINGTLRRNITRRLYSDVYGWRWETSDNPDPVLSVYIVSHEYVLRYDANGGQGAPGDHTFWHYESINLSNILPTRLHYTFDGWDENAQSAQPKYRQGVLWRIVSAPPRDIRLFAIWRADFTYLPMRPAAGGPALLRSLRNGRIIRHGDA